MQVLFGKGFKDAEDVEMKDTKGNAATLRGVCVEALLASYEDERALAGEEKLKRWELAMKIKKAQDPADLSVEEISLIKKLIGKAYGALVVGQAWSMLEGKEF
jgi:hypothetical protein